MIAASEVARLAAGLPPQALLVLDGAYAEFVPGFDGHAGLVDARDNVVMTRTFSKIYGLGGLRVGWGYAPAHVIDVAEPGARPVQPVDRRAGGRRGRASRDTAHTAFCREENTRNRAGARRGARRAPASRPIRPRPTSSSPASATRPRREACDRALRERGIIVRRIGGYKLPDCLRITVGDAEACARVAEAVADFVQVRA